MNNKKALIQSIQYFQKKHYGADSLGNLGSGAGKGGGGGGTVREAGGSLGKRAAEKEEKYFHNKNREQLEDLKKKLQEKNVCHQKYIDKHIKCIEDNKKLLKEIEENYNQKK